jgi:hypothetical protein
MHTRRAGIDAVKSRRLFVALSLGFAITVAGSEAEGQRVALVSNAGPSLKPDEFAPLFEALEDQGIRVSPSKVRAALGPRFPMAAHDPALSSAGYAKLLEQALVMWTQQPPLEKVLPVLDAAAEVIRRNPVLLIREPSQRSRVHKLLVARALAYQRAGDLKRSEESMAELICMSPDHVVSRSQDGPAAELLHQSTRANLAKRGRGTLTVKVSKPDVQVYVDERITRPGVPMGDLIPCLHRVVVIDPLDRARQYEPLVARNQHTVLEIDWDVDPTVYEMPSRIELRFQTETERLQRAELAARLVREAPGVDAFVLIDVIIEKYERHVIASLRRARGGQVLREASFVTTGDDAAAMRALARFIGGGPADPSIRVHVRADLAVQRDPAGVGAPAAVPRYGWPRYRKYVYMASTVPVLAGAAAMAYIGFGLHCSPECPKNALLIAGSAITALASGGLAGNALYYWVDDPPPHVSVGLQLDSGRRGGFVVATWNLP